MIVVPVARLAELQPGDRIIEIDGRPLEFLRPVVNSVSEDGTHVSCKDSSALRMKGQPPHVMPIDLYAASADRPDGRIRESVTVVRGDKSGNPA